MKLAAKLVSVLVVGIILVLGFDGYFSTQQQYDLYDQDRRRNTELLGSVLGTVFEDVFADAGEEKIIDLVENAGLGELGVGIRWIASELMGIDSDLSLTAEQRQNLERGRSVFFEVNSGGSLSHAYLMPLRERENIAGLLEITVPITRRSEHVRVTVLRIIVLSGVMILLSGALVVWLGLTMIGRPLHLLIGKARSIGAGDLSTPLELKGKDELTELAQALNATCDRLAEAQIRVRGETDARIEAIEQLRHADRLRTVGRLASGIAHQLGTPLNVVSGRASLIAGSSLGPEEIRSSAQIIIGQCSAVTTIIRQLLDFARRGSLKVALTDLRKIGEQTVELLTPLAKKKRVELLLTTPESEIAARVDTSQIQQVLTNLIVNAVQAMPNGGRVEVGVDRRIAQPPPQHPGERREYIRLWVKDNGPGIPEDDLAHIFEPFFTTKDVGEGTGLGLSIAHGIAGEHGGWIEVDSSVGHGTCFSIYLPPESEQ